MSKRNRFMASSSSQRRNRNASSVALSKAETVLLSSSGDVISCRCRNSPYPNAPEGLSGYNWKDDVAVLCCEADCDDLSTQLQESAIICSNWSGRKNRKDSTPRGGLLGGAPAQVVASPLHHQNGGVFSDQAVPPASSSADSLAEKAQRAFRSSPLRKLDTAFDDEESIVPIRSFDYSHFADGGNDMLPDQQTLMAPHVQQQTGIATNRKDNKEALPKFFHGVPTFLSSFLHTKVTQVSAHPLGSHVLLTTAAGLLYSYGLNDYGQLGIGVRTPVSGFHQGYIMAPTIVTPLVENGGKAITCSAGVNHSLVVIMTEERRLVKSASFDPSLAAMSRNGGSSTESIVHHQVYGFGRNDFMKIGLVSPKISQTAGTNGDTMESVVLPRRVALRCMVRPEDDANGSPLPQQGIFAVHASAEHSAALVRRASGDIELYTWGNAMHGALGLQDPTAGLKRLPGQAKKPHPVGVVPVPSFVSTLSRTSIPEAQASSLLLNEEQEYPASVSLGARCSFVVTSLGRCFSFGTSQDGMLGLGQDVTRVQKPSEIALPVEARGEYITTVSAGASHVVASTVSGSVFGWGSKLPGGLSSNSSPKEQNGNSHDTAWSPQRIQLEGGALKGRSGTSGEQLQIADAHAGYDNSVFVAKSGHVLSCGQNSGRLGQGELEEESVQSPRPMFGGFRLWQEHSTQRRIVANRRSGPPRKLLLLKRGRTLG